MMATYLPSMVGAFCFFSRVTALATRSGVKRQKAASSALTP